MQLSQIFLCTIAPTAPLSLGSDPITVREDLRGTFTMASWRTHSATSKWQIKTMTLRRPTRYGCIIVHCIALVMLLRERRTSSIVVLLLARGAGSAPDVGYIVAPAFSKLLRFLSPVLLKHCATASRLETKGKTLLNRARSY